MSVTYHKEPRALDTSDRLLQLRRLTEPIEQFPQNIKIMVVGTGSPNADIVAEALRSHGFQATWTDQVRFPNPFKLLRCDLIYGIYFQTCGRYVIAGKLFGKKTLIHFVGSDAYRIGREQAVWRRLHWLVILRLTDLVLYVSPHLQSYVKRRGFVLPFPIAASQFQSPQLRQIQPDRDVLYYCPGGARNSEIYRLSWIIDYAERHSEEKITIIGNRSCPAEYKINLPNVIVVPYVDSREMSAFYRRHKKLIRMTTEDGLPRMLSEALLCGLQVIFNDKEVNEVPAERDPREFARTFKRILESCNLGLGGIPS